MCPWPTRRGPSRPPSRPLVDGAAALLVASGCPPSCLAQPHRPVRGLGQGRGGWDPCRLARRRHRGSARPPLLRERTPGAAGLPWRRRELPFGRLHGDPGTTRPDPWPPSSSTVCSSDSRDCGSESSSRGRSGFPRGCARWSRRSRPSARHEDRLRALNLRPSDYVHRQIRFTPYPTEDVGWIIDQAGADLVMFSSDYPHVEGGRRPTRALRGLVGRCQRGRAPAVLRGQLPLPDGNCNLAALT